MGGVEQLQSRIVIMSSEVRSTHCDPDDYGLLRCGRGGLDSGIPKIPSNHQQFKQFLHDAIHYNDPGKLRKELESGVGCLGFRRSLVRQDSRTDIETLPWDLLLVARLAKESKHSKSSAQTRHLLTDPMNQNID
eukprot:4891854-Amphidinium_carterae.1